MGYTAQDIVDLLNSGQGTGSYQNVASEATNWTDTYKEQSDKFHQLLGKMEAAWVGDSGNAARGAVKPMSEASTVSADNLSKVSQNMETQSQSFVDLKGKVGDGPGPKPESTFASDYIPILSNRDEEISAWNEKAQKVVDAYNNYNTSSTDNATSLPSSYGTLSDGPEGLVFKPKSSGDGGTQRVEAPTVGGTGTSGAVGATGSGGPTTGSTAAPNLTSPTASGSAGTGTGSGTGGVGGAAGGGIGGGAVGGPGLAGQDDRTTGAVPMDRRTRAAGFEAGGVGAAAASSGAGGSSSTGMGASMVPPMAGAYGGAGGSDAAGRSGGGYGRGGGFGPGGGSGAGGSGGLGAGKGAGAMPGSGNASGAGGGQGAMGGAGKGMAAGMGRGGMGMGGMMGAGAGGRGSQGGDDDEHQDQYYVKQEMDPGLDVEQDEYGERLTDHTTGMLVVRPVIGEE